MTTRNAHNMQAKQQVLSIVQEQAKQMEQLTSLIDQLSSQVTSVADRLEHLETRVDDVMEFVIPKMIDEHIEKEQQYQMTMEGSY